MKAKEALLTENKKRQQAIIDYAKNRKVYESYKRSGYSQKFYQEYESELLIYQSAEEVYKSIPGGKMPSMQQLRDEYGRILAEKKSEFAEYAEIKKDMHEYFIAKRNLEMLYQQDHEKNEKEGRSHPTRNSQSQIVL